MSTTKRVLAFCLPGVGDTLMFTPALRALKRDLPGAQVTALTMIKEAAEMLARNPYVDEVINFEFEREGAWRSLQFVFQLRRRRYDISICGYPANRLEYNIISWLVGAKLRIGHRYRHLDWVCGNWLNNAAVREDDALTNIEENLRSVELATGVLNEDPRVDFALGDEERAFADAWVAEQGLEGLRLIGFHPGGSLSKNHIRKRWTPEQFVALGKDLVDANDIRVLVFGGDNEAELMDGIANAIGPRAVAAHTEALFESSALIARCTHFVSNDSLLLHLAGILKIPTTAIFGPTSAPWVRIPEAPRHEVLLDLPCQPCFHYSPRHVNCRIGGFPCIHQLTPERVAEEVRAVLPSA